MINSDFTQGEAVAATPPVVLAGDVAIGVTSLVDFAGGASLDMGFFGRSWGEGNRILLEWRLRPLLGWRPRPLLLGWHPRLTLLGWRSQPLLGRRPQPLLRQRPLLLM